MNVVYARNDHPGILIPCPHCHLSSRYDVEFIAEAIVDRKEIKCVACDGVFKVGVEMPDNSVRLTMREADLPTGFPKNWCFKCKTVHVGECADTTASR